METQLRRLRPSKLIFIGMLSLMLARIKAWGSDTTI